ncbi:MAG: MFS transporter [Sphingobium sp.]
MSDRARTVLLMTALLLAEVSGSFETAMIYAALNKLIAAFGDPVKVGWLVTAYMLVGAGAAAVAGRLGDIFGRRRVIEILLGMGLLGAVISASTDHFGMVLFGRILQGVTGALFPLCIGLVREKLPPALVPVNVGLIVSGAGVGTALGLVLGGAIVDNFSWHGIFWMSASLCAISIVAVRLWVPRSEPAPRAGKLDWVGGVLFVPAIFGVLLYITNGKNWGWTDPLALALLVGSVLLMVIWVMQALRSTDPLINVRLFRNRNVLVANLVAALICVAGLQHSLVMSVLLQAPLWTGVGLGVSATVAGLIKLPANACAFFAAPLSGWAQSRIGGRWVMAAGGAISTMGWISAMIFHDSALHIGLALVVISCGGTILFAVGPNIIVDSVPADRTSEAVGMMTVVRQAFIGIGAQLMSVLMASDTVSLVPGGQPRYPTEDAFMLAMGVIVVVTAAASLLSLTLPQRPKPALEP